MKIAENLLAIRIKRFAEVIAWCSGAAIIFNVIIANDAQATSHIVTHELSVTQHDALPSIVDNARADEILQEMGGLLNVQDSGTDVECAVVFVRHGDVGRFSNADVPFSINSLDDFNKLSNIPGSIKIVGEINWCSTYKPNIVGCANQPGARLAVVPYAPQREGILWLHEFGHTTGSAHRDTGDAVMKSYIDIDHREVNVEECQRFVIGSSAVHQNVNSLTSRALAAYAINEGPPRSAEAGPADEGGPEPLQEFVKKEFFEGVPYKRAKLYTDEHVSELAEILRNPEQGHYWRNAVATLGAIGSESSLEVLFSFFRENSAAELSIEEYLAKSAVPIALGWHANKSKNPNALEFLINGTNEEWWLNSSGISWTTPIHHTPRDLAASLVTKSIIGLTLTGTAEAKIRLDQIAAGLNPDLPVPALSEAEAQMLFRTFRAETVEKMNYVSPATRSAVDRSGGGEFLDAQIKDLKAVQEKGLDAYYESDGN